MAKGDPKRIGGYTAKGQVLSGGTKRLQLFDGRFDTGYRVKSLQISLAARDTTSSIIASVKLATEPNLDGTTWDWSDNREVAWGSCQADANAATVSWSADDSVIDPDNMIIEDLWIYAFTDSYTVDVNYQIELEKYDISDWQGALAMVRNKSQG